MIAGIAVAGGAEPDLGPLAACYVLLLAVCGPLLARSSPIGRAQRGVAPKLTGPRVDRSRGWLTA